MHSPTLTIAGIAAAAIVAATAIASTASAHGDGATATSQHPVSSATTPPIQDKTCYSNLTGDTGVAIASENDTQNPGLNSQGAVDFSVNRKCKAAGAKIATLSQVTTVGAYYNGAGPANSVNVILYKSKKGHPGAVVAEYDNLSYTDSGGGSLGTTIPNTTLKKGRYFLSFVANMTLSSEGQWGWELTSNQIGNIDQWQNEGGEFGVCPTWGDVLSCTGYGNDFMVALY